MNRMHINKQSYASLQLLHSAELYKIIFDCTHGFVFLLSAKKITRAVEVDCKSSNAWYSSNFALIYSQRGELSRYFVGFEP